MSAKFPDDIMKAAQRAYDALGRGVMTDELTIARAILDERERAAKIADSYAHRDTGREIAAAIRGEHQ